VAACILTAFNSTVVKISKFRVEIVHLKSAQPVFAEKNTLHIWAGERKKRKA
jgi:hypothetical protein